MTHRYRAPVRWGDMDAQGHVNNAAFLDYLQDARVDLLLGHGLKDLLDSGVLVVSHQVEYLAPLVADGRPVTVDLWVDALGGSRFVIGYLIQGADATTLVRARTGAVPFDLAAGRLRRLHAAEREALAAHLVPAEPLRAVARSVIGAGAHRWPLTVRWSDLDSYGHVNNVTFYDYLQEARVALTVQTLGGFPSQVWSLVRQDVEYLRPLDFRPTSDGMAPYQVATSVTAVGTRSLTLEAEICDPGRGVTFATGRSVVVGETPFTAEQRAALGCWS